MTDQTSTFHWKLAWQWIVFALIALLAGIVYTPSLMHVARADQVNYLAEVGHKESLWDLTVGSLDLNRHRSFTPGDEVLFRPLDYLLLGAEKYFFGNNFMAWQAVGVLLHLVVVWQLLRLLMAIYRGMAALTLTAFFAVMFTNLEMVTWHHINGYMISVAVTLAAMRRFWRVINGRRVEPTDPLVFFLLMLTAGLAHEIGNVAAVLMGIGVRLKMPQHKEVYRALLFVPLAYGTLSFINAWVHPFIITPYPQQGGVGIIANTVYALLVWGFAGLFPFQLQWMYAARNMIAPEQKHLIMWPHLRDPAVIFALVGLGMLLFFLSYRRKVVPKPGTVLLAVVCVLLTVSFAFIIALGRGSQWQIWEVIRVNTYYMYIFWVYAIVGTYALVPWEDIKVRFKAVWYLSMLALMLFNAWHLYQANEKQVKDNNDIIVLVNTLELLIKEHKNEKGLSFYVAPNYPGNYIYTELRRKDDLKTREYSYIEVLYPKYFDTLKPRYRFMSK